MPCPEMTAGSRTLRGPAVLLRPARRWQARGVAIGQSNEGDSTGRPLGPSLGNLDGRAEAYHGVWLQPESETGRVARTEMPSHPEIGCSSGRKRMRNERVSAPGGTVSESTVDR